MFTISISGVLIILSDIFKILIGQEHTPWDLPDISKSDISDSISSEVTGSKKRNLCDCLVQDSDVQSEVVERQVLIHKLQNAGLGYYYYYLFIYEDSW